MNQFLAVDIYEKKYNRGLLVAFFFNWDFLYSIESNFTGHRFSNLDERIQYLCFYGTVVDNRFFISQWHYDSNQCLAHQFI